MFALTLALWLGGCGARSVAEDTPPLAWAEFVGRDKLPLLPGADTDSQLRIATIERMCSEVRAGDKHVLAAAAYTGRRLAWKATVDAVHRRRLIVGVGQLRVELIAQAHDGEPPTFDVGDEIVVRGVVREFDPTRGWITLAPEAMAAPPR